MKHEQRKISVESLANSGDGVGRIDNKVVFIPGACPGDEVLVQIIQDKKSFAKAQIIKILKPSEDRVIPPCQYADRCGGCSWQFVSSTAQHHWKKQNLIQTLRKLGGFEDVEKVAPLVPSPKSLNYRNRIQLHVDKKGYYYLQRGSHKPVYIDQCLIASPLINQFMNEHPLLSQKGKIELAVEGQEVNVFSVNDRGQSDLGFRQVNSEQNQKLIQFTEQVILREKPQSVFDLFCGQGNWTYALSPLCPDTQFIGIDNNPVNIKKAQAAAPNNAQFLLGDCMEVLKERSEKPELVIIDPPRAGCDQNLLERLSNIGTQTMIYISCHPATLARDVKQLIESHWTLEEVIPIDMFPQTPHLETWCLLRSSIY